MREGWKYKRLGDVCDKGSSNIVINKLGDNNGDYPLFGASGLVKNVDFYHQDRPYIGIVKDGAGVGRVNTYPAFSSLVGTMQYILPKEECLLNYIKYFLIKLDLSHCVSGATIPHIYFKDYGKSLIPIPSINEQQSIVAELDKINELISLKKSQLSDLDALAQSIFYDMFGDPVVNEKGWEVKRLKDMGKVITGNTPSKSVPEYYGQKHIEWIKTDNIEKDSLTPSTAKEYLSEEGAKHGRVVSRGSLLVACIAGSLESIGKSCVTDRSVAFNQQINAITPNASTNVLFLYHLIASMKKVIEEKASTGMKHILTKGAMEEINFPLPPLPLQQSFAAKIEAIERQKQQVKQSLKDLETLLASRMQYWFDN